MKTKGSRSIGCGAIGADSILPDGVHDEAQVVSDRKHTRGQGMLNAFSL